ncbi:NUDIX hydrolase [Ancylobacter amanitiformis]|uniref:8-oxo-dGTP pyrophosphatase MutT (NUDIX family) n=1 Tax=Ancylobacter amanitiformis TaxID=217069 RepID=A0ABU0LLC8_9HYPH|nr:NUDIX hydrolase [Ancylobacter amanitiformis]MDQ0509502.1 8-oxo-dGTP pyrophosphatase MutT (NUDIX family) [Ancylobacter amanitiformis]
MTAVVAYRPVIAEIDRLDMRIDRGPCGFVEENRAAIEAHFAERVLRQPSIWNGRVLVLASHRLEAATLTGRYVETDYAALLWLLGREPAHPTARNGFAMGALRGADGGFVLARMAPWTANAGRIYFAAGTPDPHDVTADGRVDLEASVWRELAEETGLSLRDATPAPGWTALRDERRVALLRQLVARDSADDVARRIRAHIHAQERSEIDAVIIARGPDDIRADMAPFIRAYLAHVWGSMSGGRAKSLRDFSD